MRTIFWETDHDPVPNCIAFVKDVVDVVLSILSCVVSVRNRCLLADLRKLTKSEGFCFCVHPSRENIYIYIYRVWGSLDSIVWWWVTGPTLVLFLFYVNESGMYAWSCLFPQLFTIPVLWVILGVG